MSPIDLFLMSSGRIVGDLDLIWCDLSISAIAGLFLYIRKLGKHVRQSVAICLLLRKGWNADD